MWHVVAVVVLAGCASARSADGSVTTDIALQLQRVRSRVESLTGSNQDWARNSDRSAQRLQQALTECMATSGFVYIPPAPAPVFFENAVKQPFEWWGSVDVPTLTRHGFGLLEEVILAEQLEPTAPPSNPAYEALSAEGKSEFDGALSGCFDAEQQAGDDAANARGYALIHELSDSLDASLGQSGSVRSEYQSCMRAAGFATSSPSHLFDDVLMPEFDRLGAYDGDSTTPGFQQAFAFEKTVALADARCRAAGGQPLVDAVSQEVARWEELHAFESDALRALWQQ